MNDDARIIKTFEIASSPSLRNSAFMILETFLGNVRFAVRSLLRSPGVLTVAVLSLALGIGLNTTIFSAVDVFLIRPLPYPNADAILQVWNTNTERGWTETAISPPDYFDWRDDARRIDLAAYRGANFILTGQEEPERLQAQRVSYNFFRVIGVLPEHGRTFLQEEEPAGADNVVIVSHPFWQSHLAGDRNAIGRTITLNGVGHTVVGVMPPEFQFENPAIQVWAPLGLKTTEPRINRFLEVIGRLREGATGETAQAELEQLTKQLELAYPASNRSIGVTSHTLRSEMFDTAFYTASTICTVAVLFVLLIACANVANLLLVRAAAREREIAVRTALGAGRGRIAGQLLTESLVLALIGGVGGVIFSVWGVKALVSIMPAFFPMKDQIALNGRALGYTLVITLGAGFLFGLMPTLQASRPSLTSTLRDGTRNATAGRGRGRVRSALVVSEISLALVLMISAGLLIKSAVRLQTVPLGFSLDSVLTARVSLPETQYPDTAQVAAFYETVLARVRAIPGVSHVAAGRCVPMTCGMSTFYAVEGEPAVEPDRRPVVQWSIVTPDYFETLRIPVVRGRVFTDNDRQGSPRVAVVNETMAQRHWAGRDPVGQRLRFESGTCEIIGVVADTREWGPDDEAPAMVYFNEAQEGNRGLALMVRSTLATGTLIPSIRAAIAASDPQLPLFDIMTFADLMERTLGGDLILAKLLGFFAASALLLAVIGVYGVMAYSVAQRSAEMGIRMAIGAQRRDILKLVVRQGLKLSAIGLGIGLVISLGVTRTLTMFLSGVSPFDLTTFAGVSVSLALAALAASYIPALRATQVDPLTALRND